MLFETLDLSSLILRANEVYSSQKLLTRLRLGLYLEFAANFMSRFDYDPDRSNINPTLSEVKIKLYQFCQKFYKNKFSCYKT